MFHEVQFPTGISYGSRGGPGFNTNIIETDAGNEQRVQRWSVPRHTYDVAWGIKSLDDLATVRNFYIARSGCAYGFRFKDWMDFRSSANGMAAVTNADQLIGVGNGSKTTFQLIKIYTSGPSSVTRVITKPVTGTVVVALNGVNQASGWSVNTATGVITFSSAPGVGVNVTAGFEFDVPVRFGKEIDSNLAQQIEGFDNGQIGSIPLMEIMDTTMVDSEFPFGGVQSLVTTADATINFGLGRVVQITASAGGVDIALPDPTNMPDGAPVGFVLNIGGINQFALRDNLGTLLLNITPGNSAIVGIGKNSSGSKAWFAI